MNKKKAFPFKIGADPEFNILLGEQRIPAEKIMKIILKKRKRGSMGFVINNAGEIGWDGHDYTGEIRPTASDNPQEVSNNIQKLFEAMAKETKLFDISTNSFQAPVGGHIHFQIPKKINDSRQEQKKLHRQMASFYIPILTGEDIINSKLRIRSGYGYLSDFKIKTVKLETDTSEGIYTYEFRAPNAEWITTKKISNATLAYMATCFNEIINHPQNIKKMNTIMLQNESQIKAIQNLAMTRYSLILTSILTNIKKHIKTFEYYKAYKEEIDYIFNPQKILRDKEKVNFELLKGWNISNVKNITKEELLDTEKTKKLSEKTYIDEISGALAVPHNPNDTRCIDFAKALKDKVIAHNWKLNNNYFIFGLKKETKKYIIANGNRELMELGDIKTKEDTEIIKEVLLRKMVTKYMSSIDIETRPNKEKLEKVILIGIPYKKRVNIETEEFISKIYDIETGKIKKITKKRLEKRIDNNKEQGLITRVYRNGLIEGQNQLRSEGNNRDQMRNQIRMQEVIHELSL